MEIHRPPYRSFRSVMPISMCSGRFPHRRLAGIIRVIRAVIFEIVFLFCCLYFGTTTNHNAHRPTITHNHLHHNRVSTPPLRPPQSANNHNNHATSTTPPLQPPQSASHATLTTTFTTTPPRFHLSNGCQKPGFVEGSRMKAPYPLPTNEWRLRGQHGRFHPASGKRRQW